MVLLAFDMWLDSWQQKIALVACHLQAWNEDPLDTLKLIAHLRDVRGGKGEQPLFHDCVKWLLKKHPLTLIANLTEVVEVCCKIAPSLYCS